MTTPTPWPEIMAGLTGLRLALWDESLHVGAIEVRNADEQAAVDWLYRHHLVFVHEMTGYYHAQAVAAAAARWEKTGPKDSATDYAKAARERHPPAPLPAARPRVHAHQAELFHDERTHQ